MDAFSYLSVLLSIILGLAITQVLQGYRSLLLSRARVKLYAPPVIWSVLLVVFATQSWWASFGLAAFHGWTFAIFSVVLLQAMLLYMMTALVFPDMATGEIDLRAHYYHEARPFFAIAIAMLCVSIGKDVMVGGRLPAPANLGFHLFFAVIAAIAIITRRPRFHEIAAPLMAVFVVAYIALLFARL
jgi:hypothetical protein